jgi:hypothetical protein
MFDSHPMLPQNAPDQQAAVATGGILFAAQESYTELAETPFQAYEAFLKQRRIGHAIVEDMPFGVVKLGPVGPSAQFLSHMEVADVLNG